MESARDEGFVRSAPGRLRDGSGFELVRGEDGRWTVYDPSGSMVAEGLSLDEANQVATRHRR